MDIAIMIVTEITTIAIVAGAIPVTTIVDILVIIITMIIR